MQDSQPVRLQWRAGQWGECVCEHGADRSAAGNDDIHNVVHMARIGDGDAGVVIVQIGLTPILYLLYRLVARLRGPIQDLVAGFHQDFDFRIGVLRDLGFQDRARHHGLSEKGQVKVASKGDGEGRDAHRNQEERRNLVSHDLHVALKSREAHLDAANHEEQGGQGVNHVLGVTIHSDRANEKRGDTRRVLNKNKCPL